MRRALGLGLLLACCAAAQLQLYVAPVGGSEQPVSGIYDLGRTYVGDSMATRFRIWNRGTAAVTLTALHASGSGFTMAGAPSVPHTVAAGTNVDFTIHFRPPDHGSFSANVQINGTGYLMRGAGIASAAFFFDGLPLMAGSTVDFGRIERGAQRTLTFEARNTTASAVAIRTVEASGDGFSLVDAPPMPAEIAAGGVLRVGVRFAPEANRIFTGRLVIDSTRVIQLTGTGLEPPLPRPVVILESSAVRSGEQGRVVVRLSEPSRGQGAGQLRMELKPSGQIKDNDAGAQLLTGGRVASFTISEGSDAVVFDKTGGNEILFQAGTTAGTLEFVVEAGGYTERTSVAVAPEAVRIDRATAGRNGGSIEVSLSGFDNSRSIGEMTFTFHGANGQVFGPLRVNAAADFTRWWETSTHGGTFAMTAAFPVTGDSTQIRAVDVEIKNASGASKTDKLSF